MHATSLLPRPPVTTRLRSQLEAFLVLQRNILELWGARAYTETILPGRFLGRSQLMVSDPEAIRHVLVTNADNYTRNPGTQRVLQPLLGTGLFLAEGDAWKNQRRTIAPAMTPRSMPVLAGHVMQCTERAMARLPATGGCVMLLETMQRLALDIAAQSMFSLEAANFRREMRTMLVDYGTTLARPALLDIMLPAGIATPRDRVRARFRQRWLRLMDRIIDTREAQGPPPGEARDLFDMLAAARDPETQQAFDRAQLRDEVSTMIIAGHETTAATLFWACFVAAKLPAWQDRIADEVAGLDLSSQGAAASLSKLVVTKAFLEEVLRLYPPAFLIVRLAKADDVVGGHPVPAGTVISISPWVLHRHHLHWRDPETFNPRRFMPGAEPPARFTYLPFGAGPRICVGAQFAMTEACLVLARLLQEFRLELMGGEAMRPVGRVTTQPDRPVRFWVSRRAATAQAPTLSLAFS